MTFSTFTLGLSYLQRFLNYTVNIDLRDEERPKIIRPNFRKPKFQKAGKLIRPTTPKAENSLGRNLSSIFSLLDNN